jgi:hypothetical protein
MLFFLIQLERPRSRPAEIAFWMLFAFQFEIVEYIVILVTLPK